MTNDMREKYLTNLASMKGEEAERALKKAGEKIALKLKEETRYDLINDQLRYLNPISYRVPELTILMLKNFLSFLDTIELTYQPIKWTNEQKMREFYSKDELRKKALKIFENLRYIKTSEVFDTLLEYSINESEGVKKTAIEALKSLAAYNIRVFRGLGPKPQEDALEKMQALSTPQKGQYFSALLGMCDEILSPTMEATQWNYKTVTISTGAVPVQDKIVTLRQRTIEYVAELFFLTPSPKRKRKVLNVLQQATRTPSNANYDDKFYKMILDDTVRVLKLFEGFIADAPLEVIQSIEHDTFWMFRRRGKDAVADAALHVRDVINANQEYQIFKILIGFEGVFEEWTDERDDPDFAGIEKYRDTKAKEFSLSISTANYDVWRERILSYAQIKSDDMATFPIFGKFLNYFAEASPLLALRLLTGDAAALDRFLPGLLIGIWSTNKRADVKDLMNRWIEQNLFLFQVARIFEFTPDVDLTLLMRVFEKAKIERDVNTLAQIISTAVAHTTLENRVYLEILFVPAIKALTELEDSRWIFNFWFRQQRKQVLQALDAENIRIILNNLVFLKKIDYHAEEVLVPIAEDHPRLVINFFAKRLARENSVNDEYEAIPFELHRLGNPLSQHPDMVFEIIFGWSNDELFQFKGARLLADIFKGSMSSLATTLIREIKSSDIKKIDAVLATLRNFEGEVELHPIFKELVKILSDDDLRLNEIAVALETTGVVGGEFGFVEAWRNKQNEVKPWLEDADARVRKFAKKYIDDLSSMIDAEQRRTEERIKLQKFEWGGDEA